MGQPGRHFSVHGNEWTLACFALASSPSSFFSDPSISLLVDQPLLRHVLYLFVWPLGVIMPDGTFSIRTFHLNGDEVCPSDRACGSVLSLGEYFDVQFSDV
jgi:hypothetical protein